MTAWRWASARAIGCRAGGRCEPSGVRAPTRTRCSPIGRPTSRSAPSTWTAATLAQLDDAVETDHDHRLHQRVEHGAENSVGIERLAGVEVHGTFLSTGRRAEDSTGVPSGPRRWRARSAPSHTMDAAISTTPIANTATPIGRA